MTTLWNPALDVRKTINNAICALLFRCEQQSVKEMDKIHAMQLFIKVAELESFPARRISLLCQREVFRARYRHWNINLAPSFSSALRDGSNSRQKAWPIINGQKMCWVISANWTVCFNRMPPVSAVNYASTSRQESRKTCYCRVCRNFSISIRELSWNWVAITVR